MNQGKANIFLKKIDERIDLGEFDNDLNIPFASRKLLKALIKSKMDKKVKTNATPILSENNIMDCIKEVKETAVTTVALFLEIGILEKVDGEYKVNEKWENFLKKQKDN